MMAAPAFLMGIETECLTAVAPCDGEWGAVVAAFLTEMRRSAPSLAGPGGFFNGYGRVYLDGNRHLELASAECDSPYTLAAVVARQQALAARAVAALKERRNIELILANNNHSGRLSDGAPTWGAHENYLVAAPPEDLADQMLPFLVSRVYGGAGGLWHPTGVFLAGVRVVFLQTDVGGGTTQHRAVFSTARQEHLQGTRPAGFRCHLILGDGHRSHFNLALHYGATTLVLAAVQHDPACIHPLPRLAGVDQRRFWLTAARHFNRLAELGEPPRVTPLAIEVQRFYLDRARRFAETLRPHPWADRLLTDWELTLDKMAAGDYDWLAARLDAWIKHRLFGQWLRAHGRSWHDLARRPHLFNGLVLLDQNYHEFANPDSVFDHADRADLLAHRVGPIVAPGSEAEPFTPETPTRARARARFLRTNDGDSNLEVDWASVHDRRGDRCRWLSDPFATEYGPWVPSG
jgi:proteasome accessory factor A